MLIKKATMKFEGFGLVQKHDKKMFRQRITDECDLYRVWHLGVPETSATNWVVTVDGAVNHPLELTIEQLRMMKHVSITSFQECAGSPIYPEVPQRRVGNIIWKGVLLSDVLALAGVKDGAKYVHSAGVDHGIFNGKHYDSYGKDLPLQVAQTHNVLLALEVNGTSLSTDRGGPVRLVVPGYYATNSTKWVNKITLAAERCTGDFTTRYYMDRDVVEGVETATPVWEIKPNSLLVYPESGTQLENTEHMLWGWTWGYHPVTQVGISTDGGLTWQAADVEEREENGWQRFSFNWKPHTVGEYNIMIKASDAWGNQQPMNAKRNQVYRAIVFVV